MFALLPGGGQPYQSLSRKSNVLFLISSNRDFSRGNFCSGEIVADESCSCYTSAHARSQRSLFDRERIFSFNQPNSNDSFSSMSDEMSLGHHRRRQTLRGGSPFGRMRLSQFILERAQKIVLAVRRRLFTRTRL